MSLQRKANGVWVRMKKNQDFTKLKIIVKLYKEL